MYRHALYRVSSESCGEGGGKEAATLPAPLLTPFPWRLFNLRDEVILNERATPASYNKDDSSDN